MTSAELKASWPEFADVSDPLVSAKLAAAVTSVDPALFGDQTEEAIGNMACHLLTQTPYGAHLRIASKDLPPSGATSLYQHRFIELRDAATCGIRSF